MLSIAAASLVTAVALPLYRWWQSDRTETSSLLRAGSAVVPALGVATTVVGYYEHMAQMVEASERMELKLLRQKGEEVEVVHTIMVPQGIVDMLGRAVIHTAFAGMDEESEERTLVWGRKGWALSEEEIELLLEWFRSNLMQRKDLVLQATIAITRLFSALGKKALNRSIEVMVPHLLDAYGVPEADVRRAVASGLLANSKDGQKAIIEHRSAAIENLENKVFAMQANLCGETVDAMSAAKRKVDSLDMSMLVLSIEDSRPQ